MVTVDIASLNNLINNDFKVHLSASVLNIPCLNKIKYFPEKSVSANELAGRSEKIPFTFILVTKKISCRANKTLIQPRNKMKPNTALNYSSHNQISAHSSVFLVVAQNRRSSYFNCFPFYVWAGMQQVSSWRGRAHRHSTRSTKQDVVVVAEKIVGNSTCLATRSKPSPVTPSSSSQS